MKPDPATGQWGARRSSTVGFAAVRETPGPFRGVIDEKPCRALPRRLVARAVERLRARP